jgi:hypothetical protein
MKTLPVLLVLSLLSPVAALQAHEGCTCGSNLAAPVVAASADASKRHPLKGVVVSVVADKSALLVKHEEIPGVMKAMTMLLKIDAETLKSPAAVKDASITGLLVRKADGWWLEEAKVDLK